MRIAVATPAGHVGSLLADYLLDAGADLRLLARHADKLKRQVARGAGVAEGSLKDVDFVVQATSGVDVLFWVTPPDYSLTDYRSFQDECGRAAAEAIRVNRIGRIVNLSSEGAQLASGGGPINGLHDVEELLDDVSTNITHLRPAFFFENFMFHTDTIRSEGRIYLPVSGSTRIPMLAAKDVARIAADRILDPCWNGHWRRSLHGPTDLSFDEAAEFFTEGCGREILFARVDESDARQAMIGLGMSENVAEMLLELYESFESGTIRNVSEPRSPWTYTPTRLIEFVKEVIQPIIAQPVTTKAQQHPG